LSTTAGAEDRAPTGWATFRHRDFTLYCIARFVSAMAIQMQNVGIGWMVYDLTRDPFALGFVGLLVFMPAVGLVLFTGHAADRFDRRRILTCCYALAALTASGLLWFSSGHSGVWPIYGLVLLFGCSRAFAGPAAQALVPNLVPLAEFRNAIAWASSVGQTATIIGPAAGGLLYALGGSEVVFGTATAAFALTSISFAAIRPKPPKAGGREPVSWVTLLAGLQFIRSRPAIMGAVTLDLFAVLLGGATALLPIFARDILHVGPSGLGVLRSMPALGAVTMALLMAYRPLTRRSGRRMLQAVAVFGLATIGFGLSTNLYVSLACLFVLGAADMISVFVRQTLVQIDTPDAMRGRVAAVNTVFIGASNELGEFESGVLAGLVGTVGAVVLGGVGTLTVAALWARWFPALRDRDRLIE
jgi:MFS family permease